MNKQILKFDLSPQDVQIKKILNRDFLELSIYAISDIYPNRNDSHFTIEAMQEALHTFYNKPILGYFNKLRGDFEQHNGKMEYDKELEEFYWDCNSADGERILGVIRESDNVEIVKEGGFNWIKLSCVLWTQYSYRQVKKLLKSPKKKVSVEIQVDKYHYDENNIMIIDSFTLSGITILGDRIKEGIQNAHLSVLDAIHNEMYEKKVQCLSFAYSKNDNQNINPENESNLDDKSVLYNNAIQEENDMEETCRVENVDNEVSNVNLDESTELDHFAESDVSAEVNTQEEPEAKCDSLYNSESDVEAEGTDFAAGCGSEDEGEKECALSADSEDGKDSDDEEEKECKLADEDSDEPEDEKECGKFEDGICPDCGEPAEDCKCSSDEEPDKDDGEDECKFSNTVEINGEVKTFEEVVSMYNSAKEELASLRSEFDSYKEDVDAKMAAADEKYAALSEEYESLKGQVKLAAEEKLAADGIAMAAEEDELDDEDRAIINEKCAAHEYNSLDEVESDIACFIYKKRKNNRQKNFKANIVTPVAEKNDEKKDVFAKLKDYNN